MNTKKNCKVAPVPYHPRQDKIAPWVPRLGRLSPEPRSIVRVWQHAIQIPVHLSSRSWPLRQSFVSRVTLSPAQPTAFHLRACALLCVHARPYSTATKAGFRRHLFLRMLVLSRLVFRSQQFLRRARQTSRKRSIRFCVVPATTKSEIIPKKQRAVVA
jgi:hypothetical protein